MLGHSCPPDIAFLMLHGTVFPFHSVPRPARREDVRRWECIYDPDGVFQGRMFRHTDLMYGGGFTPGTVFRNIQTGQRKVVVEGNRTRTVDNG